MGWPDRWRLGERRREGEGDGEATRAQGHDTGMECFSGWWGQCMGKHVDVQGGIAIALGVLALVSHFRLLRDHSAIPTA